MNLLCFAEFNPNKFCSLFPTSMTTSVVSVEILSKTWYFFMKNIIYQTIPVYRIIFCLKALAWVRWLICLWWWVKWTWIKCILLHKRRAIQGLWTRSISLFPNLWFFSFHRCLPSLCLLKKPQENQITFPCLYS